MDLFIIVLIRIIVRRIKYKKTYTTANIEMQNETLEDFSKSNYTLQQPIMLTCKIFKYIKQHIKGIWTRSLCTQ